MERKNWGREDLLVAFAAYCRTPFGKIYSTNPEIVELARLLGRSANAVAMKMVNFARLDPVLRARGVRGLSHGGKGEVELWQEFLGDTARVAIESELALQKLVKPESGIALVNLEGPTDVEKVVRVRLVQSFFRRTVLSSYNYSCSFCGLQIREMLVASHIIPWKSSIERRADPRNGISLCTFHDRAFDRGLLAIDTNMHVLVSDNVSKISTNEMARVGLLELAGRTLNLADRFQADPIALQYHREQIFRNG